MPTALLVGPIGKFIGGLLLVAAIFGAGYYRGFQAEKQAWDAAIAEQAVKSAGVVIKAAENTAVVVTKYIKVKGATETVFQTIEKEVIRYVEAAHPDCFIPRQFEWVWDDANGLPAAAGPAGRTDAGDDSGLSPAEILQAHADDANSRAELWDRYAALRDWVASSYLIQKDGAGR